MNINHLKTELRRTVEAERGSLNAETIFSVLLSVAAQYADSRYWPKPERSPPMRTPARNAGAAQFLPRRSPAPAPRPPQVRGT